MATRRIVPLARYSCPKCSSAMSVAETFDGRCRISCRCGISCTMEMAGELNRTFLEFLRRYNSGEQLQDDAQSATIRAEDEIAEIIGKADPDETILSILHTKQDYVCHYRCTDSPGPPPGGDMAQLGLSPALKRHLSDSGISGLYAFQEEAYRAVTGGSDMVIVAPTASGKTEAFLVPIVQMISEGRDAVFALMVYPTKALARDQHAKIWEMARSVGARSAVFDGDTPEVQRRSIIESPPHILVTNFDVINYHLPRRTKFAALLSSARVMVVDEVHTYTGIFGSNVHYLIKRLARTCRYRLQVVAASATIQEPSRFCAQLFERDVTLVKSSGRRGRTDLVMLFPSLRKQWEMILDVASNMTKRGHKTLVFSNSHRSAELLAMDAKRAGVSMMVHRAGLSTAYRRRVEDRFRNGSLMAISCTPTLELGVDIGSVDGVVSTVVPVNRLLQRIGRAARKGQRGYAILALGDDPISQYYMSRPNDYFEDTEVPYIDPKNPLVEEYHVMAMACDAPLADKEAAGHASAVDRCVDAGLLERRSGMILPRHERVSGVLEKYNIRGMGESISIMVRGRRLGERVLPMAIGELYKDAVYFMAGRRYRVRRLAYPDSHYADLEPVGRNYHPYYTQPLVVEWPTVRATHDTKTVWGTQIAHCTLNIRKEVIGYVEKGGVGEMAGRIVSLETPVVYDFATKGVVFCAPVPEDAAAASEDHQMVQAGAYHAAEHTIIEGSNMITGGAARDLGGVSLGTSGAIFVYDSAIGGNGASRALYDRMESAIKRSRQILSICPCKSFSGCPRCTYSYRCGNNNEPLSRVAALEVLTRMMDGQRSDLLVPEDGQKPLV